MVRCSARLLHWARRAALRSGARWCIGRLVAIRGSPSQRRTRRDTATRTRLRAPERSPARQSAPRASKACCRGISEFGTRPRRGRRARTRARTRKARRDDHSCAAKSVRRASADREAAPLLWSLRRARPSRVVRFAAPLQAREAALLCAALRLRAQLVLRERVVGAGGALQPTARRRLARAPRGRAAAAAPWRLAATMTGRAQLPPAAAPHCSAGWRSGRARSSSCRWRRATLRSSLTACTTGCRACVAWWAPSTTRPKRSPQWWQSLRAQCCARRRHCAKRCAR